MMAWTRRRGFWIAYALLAVAALALAWRLFPLAIPLVNLDITLARHEALQSARALAAQRDLAPAAPRSAVRFTHDDTLQNYVELEGGGKPAFAKIMAGNAYAPYWWEVRLFVPGEIREALVRLRPDGTPDGFVKKLPETYVPSNAAAAALSAADARSIAEARAVADWHVDLAHYRPLEQTQQRRTGGRVDHTFVYERTDAQAGDARFRVRLVVSGNELTELTTFAFVPEAFTRRYAELRSANNTIAGAAGLAAGVLYGLGGCVLGVLWLLRQHALAWRPAVVAGLVVGGLMGAASLAGTPAAWFGYDTADPVMSFWARQIGGAIIVFVGGGLAYALVFMAAESLSRRAFPLHPQLWKLWSREAAPTVQVLGRTVGGYMFVGVELAFIALFYYATNRWLGWWQPSEALTDPNILGSAVPAMAPIAISLQAGFMEECLFRAVPLSLAALIGARYGNRGMALAIAAVLQAIIFGSAHANYPGFPAYSRPVELFLPSLVWALLFMRFGLLTTILLHALFDLSLFSIPLFLVDAPGASVQRALVIAVALVPLSIVLLRRRAAGAWLELPGALRNAGWERTHAPVAPAPRRETAAPVSRWVVGLQRVLPGLGVAGFILWLFTADFRADVPPLPLSRPDAIAIAEKALTDAGHPLGPEWRRFARVRLVPQETPLWIGHEFVWREAGPETYRALVGKALAPPLWEVRFARFEGDVAERAEEWRITVEGTGAIRQVRHSLPEGRPGATLERDAALAIAERALRERMQMDPAAMKLVSARQEQQPARRDWIFEFADPAARVGQGGEARAQVLIAGDQVSAYGRYVFVPETWERQQRERESQMLFAKLALLGFVGLAAVAAIVYAAMQWTRRHYDRHALRVVALAAFLLSAIGIANNWPLTAMGLRSTEPVASQVALGTVGALVGAVFAALVVAFITAIGAWGAVARAPYRFARHWPSWVIGASAALLVAGLGAGLGALAPQTSPVWPTYGVASQALPLLGAALAGAAVLGAIGASLFLLAWLDALTHEWHRHVWLAGIVLMVVLTGVAVIGAANPFVAIAAGLLSGAVAAVTVYGALRLDLRTLPAYVATGAVLGFIESGVRNATTASYAQAALASVVAIAVGVIATRYLTLRMRAAHGSG